MRLGRRLKNKPWVQKTIGTLAAEYLRLVWTTSRFTMEPAEPYRLYEAQQPVIIAMWHGQHFLLPFLRRQYRFRVLISRHSDGEINAIAAERLGVGTVRGSGDHGTRFHIKGGVAGFKAMLDSLEQGWNMALTADVPKVSRVAGRGIIKLAQEFGTTDLSCQSGHQPPDRARQLGSLGNQPAVQPRRNCRRRTGPRSQGCGHDHAATGPRDARKSAQHRDRTRARDRRPAVLSMSELPVAACD